MTSPFSRGRGRRSAFASSLVPALLAPALLGAAAVVAVALPTAPTGPATRLVSAARHAPIGHVDRASVVPGGLRVVGWDYDPDAPRTALRTYVTVDHKLAKSVTAKRSRPGVARKHPKAGARHGFNFVVPVREGRHLICISAKNVGRGKNHVLRKCARRQFDYGPVGSAPRVTSPPGSVRVRGWADDLDRRRARVTVVVTVDRTAHVVSAAGPRAGLRKTHPSWGVAHGYDVSYPVSQGRHTVCVTGRNIGFGSDNGLGCKTIVVNDDPTLAVNTLGKGRGTLHVRGWAFDRDAAKTALNVLVSVDGALTTLRADKRRADLAKAHPSAGALHGFNAYLPVAEGVHTVCLTVANVGLGANTNYPCRSVRIAVTPTAALTAVTATPTGVTLTGWASDPDTRKAISVQLLVDGTLQRTVVAKRKGATRTGHEFRTTLRAASGAHRACAIGLNVSYGTRNSTPACQSLTLALSPLTRFTAAGRAAGGGALQITGWAFDPDTTAPLQLAVSVDGAARPAITANAASPDMARQYPGYGAAHGFAATLTADAGEHRVCLVARNVGGGADASLGCKIVNAVHPVPPSVPTAVRATPDYGSAIVSWTPPASDGGAPWTTYVVTASPGGRTATASPAARSVVVSGLAARSTYSFTVVAVNVAGRSAGGRSAAITTPAGPGPQTTPAPVATSRYLRNLGTGAGAELTRMRAAGLADAKGNPSGHRYLVLLDIGGQDQLDGGVVLSATTRFVPYAALVRDLDAYVDGYHAGQRSTAPATIAIGTNNDMDVTTASGAAWANSAVDPVVNHARGYAGLSIAGANDIEPGFRASYKQTASWLAGYLANTSAKFVFNGSADGCSWTLTGRRCNNGWSMSGLYELAGGAAPTRIVNLPQVYNMTMAAQWKYISLTGVAARRPRVNFGGVLTEWTACSQTGGCGSLTGRDAWTSMWRNLQSDSRLRVTSLPYATDLRIN
ncbi:fibronectin type III domain-containing protein [uncultured Jatrophihabitans sp.]|uniref:fibronectin type III domain-containing protein n=1 Tax=uncultured Jatrophihabitans sp. TaxID=1610747 RepID=UPI0035C97386